MRILVVGTEFENQGARLMLDAIVQQIAARPGYKLVLEHTVGSFKQKRLVGADALTPYRLQRHRLPNSVEKTLPYIAGIVTPNQVDAVFDASGFRYGDQWAHLDLDKTADRLVQYSNAGIPVYLLPQAMGPFKITQSSGRKVLSAARIAFPRDPDSAQNALELMPSLQNIKMNPDFTVAVEGKAPPKYSHLVGAVPIIPNWNIVDRASSVADAQQYIHNLSAIVRQVREMGLQPYGLSHEGARDTKILRELQDQLSVPLDIVSGLEGLQLKGLIGTAKFTVSGRFHAIASALAQGVPTLVHGWSHKYKWLLSDFGAQPVPVDPYGTEELQLEAFEKLTHWDRNDLKKYAIQNKRKIESMWQAVFDDLEACRS